MQAGDWQDPYHNPDYEFPWGSQRAAAGMRDDDLHNPYAADMWASGPGDGPSMAVAAGVALGSIALIGGAMWLLGGRAPSIPSTDDLSSFVKRETGFGAIQNSVYGCVV